MRAVNHRWKRQALISLLKAFEPPPLRCTNSPSLFELPRVEDKVQVRYPYFTLDARESVEVILISIMGFCHAAAMFIP